MRSKQSHSSSFAFLDVHGGTASQFHPDAIDEEDDDSEGGSPRVMFAEVEGFQIFHRISSVTSSSAADVRMAREVSTGEAFAVKVLPQVRRLQKKGAARARGAGGHESHQTRQARRFGVTPQAAVEIEALQRLEHPNIVKYALQRCLRALPVVDRIGLPLLQDASCSSR